MKENKLGFLSPSRHMVAKIWIHTMCIVTVALITLAILMNAVMRESWINRSLSELESGTSASAAAVSDTYAFMMNRFVEIFGTDDFSELYPRLVAATQQEQAALNNSVQSMLSSMIHQCPQVQSAALVNRSGIAFTLLSNAVKPGILTFLMGHRPDEFHHVTILPCTQSPFVGYHSVIPFAIPIRALPNSGMLSIADSADDAGLILYLFLDAELFNAQLNIYTTMEIGSMLLFDSRHGILNHTSEDGSAHEEIWSALEEQLPSCLSASDRSGILTLKGCRAVWHKESYTEAAVICLVDEAALLSTQNQLFRQLPVLLLASLAMITLVALFVSRTISKPLKALMGTIASIGDGTYSSDLILPRQDELGRLSVSIDTMYHTIQQQMEEINNERDAKVNAELRLISEQINPHFLYNTLESINMEVYAHRHESASAMIQNLGEFLRIGLSFGNRMISVSRELQHVQAYVNIMNSRFDQHLIFSSSVDPDCMDRNVPKVILQPLVENAIRHGFRVDEEASGLQDQFISVEIHTAPDGGMDLSVIDNGIGIDVAKAEESLHAAPSERHHVGLGNVYQRLVMQYGPEAGITFDSIPYFRNTVCIHIPGERPES